MSEESSTRTTHACPHDDCGVEFSVDWSATEPPKHAKTRYCPRCGGRL